jgi:hypothetical protein
MKIRFEVDQAFAFRHGYDCPKRIVAIDVNPADLAEHVREAIAIRMIGTDVYTLYVAADFQELKVIAGANEDERLLAPFPTWEGFLLGLQEDIDRVKPEIDQILQGINIIKASGVRLSGPVADRFSSALKRGSADGLIALERFLRSGAADPTPKPELN